MEAETGSALIMFYWKRMFLGDEPPLFLIEILFRTLVIYAYTFILLRWLGSRTIGQLSTIEFLLVIALGSAVGDAMFYPDVPLVHALLVSLPSCWRTRDWTRHRQESPRCAVVNGSPREAIHDGC